MRFTLEMTSIGMESRVSLPHRREDVRHPRPRVMMKHTPGLPLTRA